MCVSMMGTRVARFFFFFFVGGCKGVCVVVDGC